MQRRVIQHGSTNAELPVLGHQYVVVDASFASLPKGLVVRQFIESDGYVAQFRIHPDDPEECFKDGQEYYGTALHEMAHSTGHPSRLDRLKPAAFGSPEYAKEELVAEQSAAASCLCRWVIAIDKYIRVKREIEPLEKKCAEAQATLVNGKITNT